ncbi:MAG: tRNA lysidine(34) synthetase TilS [bacterium]
MNAEVGASLLDECPAEVLLRASRHRLAARISEGLTVSAIGSDEPMLLLVSGGSDSMAMLVSIAAMRARRASFPRGLAVLSIDHGLREAAAAEVASVLATARALGIEEVYARKVNIAEGANVLGAAREARYAAATELARTLGGRTIVVAHQAEDRAESYLMALARREGLGACTKLMPRRKFPEWGGAKVARPFLDLTRAELQAFLRDCGVRWIDDPSNVEHRRGTMRGDPSLRRLVAEIAGGLSLASDEAAELLQLRDHMVAQVLSVDGRSCGRDAFDELPAVARRATLLRIAARGGASLSHATLVAASSCAHRAERRFACSGGRELVLGRNHIVLDGAGTAAPGARAAAGNSETSSIEAAGTHL